MNLNQVVIAGRLGKDPEKAYTANNTAITKLNIAVSSSYKTAGGERRDSVEWIYATAFGKTAENLYKYFVKGKPVYIEGRLRTEKWTDKQTGQERSRLSVIVDRFHFFPINTKDDIQHRRENVIEPGGDSEFGTAGDPGSGDFYGNDQDPF